MIRFYNSRLVESNNADITMSTERIFTGGGYLWEGIKDYFRKHVSDAPADIRMLPVVNGKQEVACYAWQDSEANRELRMLKELEKNGDALQFRDIFPEIKEVAVCGCNELACHFVRYLERQRVSVTVTGKYWDYFGYDSCWDDDLDGADRMVIYAEGVMPKTGDIFQDVMRSASPEFECIDKIYEANVLEGRINDARGNVEWLLERLRGKEVIILGTDAGAQDAYDFLYGHGIDICCFAEWDDKLRTSRRTALLGKKAFGVEECINSRKDAIFVSNSGKDSALGTAGVELFDYYGYVRNENFFLLRDYTEVPCTNLLNVLSGKKVFFAGDEALCAMVSGYLEEWNIYTEYVGWHMPKEIKETDIFCVVNLWYSWVKEIKSNPKVWQFREALRKEKFISYTEYFAQTRVLVNIDLHRGRGKEKYSIKELRPKGILLGKIPGVGGNTLFDGILDGHLDILKLGYGDLRNSLFLCCIRLAEEKAGDVLKAFGKMYWKEREFWFDRKISNWDKFEKSAKTLLSLKESFTSQELFVILHIAYAEMMFGYEITDISRKIIYWEPHIHPRDEHFPFFAQWLEDEQIHGQTVCMHRDMVVRTGSVYTRLYRHDLNWTFGNSILQDPLSGNITYKCWKEFHMRFEDIKLHPQRVLLKLCGRIGLPWSDTMLHVTENGQECDWFGIFGFDIKPVFNKHEEVFSEFDRLRISLLNSPYQEKYGYTYEGCMQFSRSELQEMFVKEFRFQKELPFKCKRDKTVYLIRMNRELMKMLWQVRKHTLMNDIVPEFGEVEIGESITKQEKRVQFPSYSELDRLIRFVKKHEWLVLYGIGRDCSGLLGHLSEKDQSKLVFSDLKAEYEEQFFHGKKVIAPSELCGKLKEYKILVTPSKFYKDIRRYLEWMGVDKDRIVCNRFQLWQ